MRVNILTSVKIRNLTIETKITVKTTKKMLYKKVELKLLNKN